jgi:hypothetical protein
MAPFVAHVVLLAGTIRAAAPRFREDAAGTVSLLTVGGQPNMTSLHQADHRVLVRPSAAAPPGLVPTVAIPNRVTDTARCNRITANAGFCQQAAG